MKLMKSVFLLLLLCACVAGVQAAPTTSVHLVKFADDGTTVLNETTVDYGWMEANLPVLGDGATHYYHQGPVFSEDKEAQWDRNETTNFKDRGAVKGTDVRDLCDLIGGMQPGDEVMIHASDGYHVEFDYANVWTPEPGQGQMGLCWYNGEEVAVGERQGVGYPPDYYMGMRLVFFADNSTNPEGKHVFGNQDMRESFPPEAIHLFNDLYPSTSGYTVKWIDEIRVYTGGYQGEKNAPVKSLQGSAAPATTTPQSPAPLFATLTALLLCFFVRRVAP
jgi:hypothetical protein